VKYLLDTHVFLWWITDSPRIPENIRKVIEDKNSELFLSAASIWEMMIKSKLNKLQLPDNQQEFIREQLTLNSLRVLNITMEHSFEVYGLPEIHKDPFDRMLIAQARVEGFTIITSDAFIEQYNVDTYW
jgi:PIN domain nuclease of toxin-antitoxin system